MFISKNVALLNFVKFFTLWKSFSEALAKVNGMTRCNQAVVDNPGDWMVYYFNAF